jgi:hypothetical protein
MKIRKFSWWPWTPYSSGDAARNGKKDGQHGIPDEEEQTYPAYIMQLKQVGEENIERLSQQWKRRDAVLLAEYCKAATTLTDLQKALEKAEQEAAQAREEGRRAQAEHTKHFHVTPTWYYVMIGAIFLLEVPLNSVVFQLFGDSKTFTLLTSIGLGIVLPLCAHFLGGLLRHGFWRAGKWATETLLILALFFTAVGSLAGIAYLRERFFAGSGVQELLGVQMDYTIVTLIFFAINLLIFAVATVAAYVSHDPLAKQHWQDLRTANKLRRNAEKKVSLTERRLQETQARQQEIRAERQKSFEHTRHEIDELRNIIQRLMSVYAMHNQRHRGSTKKPACLEKYPPINTRDPLLDPHTENAQLEWECSSQLATVPADVPQQFSIPEEVA